MRFNDAILAGIVLNREAIQSDNFVTGVSGWRVTKSGSAEFNDIIIRDGTVVSGEAFYYDPSPGLGNLVLSIAATAGTDTYGNAYPAGLTVFSPDGNVNTFDGTTTWLDNSGSEINIGVGGAQALQQLTPADVGGITWNKGSFGTNITSELGANTPSVFIESPSAVAFPAKSSIRLHGGGTSSTNEIQMVAQNTTISGDVQLIGGKITEYDNDDFDSFTPVITNGGTATFNNVSGWTQKIGKMRFVSAAVTVNAAGSGASNVGMTLPFTMEGNFGDQIIPARFAETRLAYGILFSGADSATLTRFRIQDGGAVNDCRNLIGTDLTAGRILSIQGWLREA